MVSSSRAGRRGRHWLSATVVVMALVAAACGDDDNGGASASGDGSGTEQEQETYELSLALSSPAPSEEHAPIGALPLELGYFEEEGLDVEVRGYGESDAMQLLLSGEVDVVAPSAWSGTMIPQSNGADTVCYYTVTPKFFQPVAVLDDSDIQTWADLEGKRIGVTAAGANPTRLEAVAESEGVPAESLTFVPVGVGAEAAEALVRGDVDALGLWEGSYVTMENEIEDLTLRRLHAPIEDELGFQMCLTVMRERLEEDPEPYIRLARSIAKATVFAMENPQAAAWAAWQLFPDSRPPADTLEEALEKGANVAEARLRYMDPRVMEPPCDLWGCTQQEWIQTLYDEVILPSGDLGPEEIDLGNLITEEHLEEINDFDEEEVRAAAQAWEPPADAD